MGWIVGGFVALAAIGAVVGFTMLGTADAVEGETAGGEVQAVNLAELREQQRLSNAVFEVVPGEVLQQGRNRGTPGDRWYVRVRVQSFDERNTLHPSFWELSVVGFDSGNREISTDIARVDSGVFAVGGRGIRPLGEGVGTLIITGDDVAAFHATLTYNEPGRTTTSASFIWPYGR